MCGKEPLGLGASPPPRKTKGINSHRIHHPSFSRIGKERNGKKKKKKKPPRAKKGGGEKQQVYTFLLGDNCCVEEAKKKASRRLRIKVECRKTSLGTRGVHEWSMIFAHFLYGTREEEEEEAPPAYSSPLSSSSSEARKGRGRGRRERGESYLKQPTEPWTVELLLRRRRKRKRKELF